MKPDFNTAIQFHQAHRLEEAVAVYRAILAERPHAPSASNLSTALMQLGRDDEALAAARLAVQIDSNAVEARLNVASILQRQKNWTAALKELDAAIALHPGEARAHNNRGLCLENLNQLDAAVAAFQTALRIQPNLLSALNNLANTLRDQGHRDQAIALLRHALALHPNEPRILSNLAGSISNTGALNESIILARRAVQLQPNDAESHNNLGHSLKLRGNVDQAIAEFAQSVRLEPTSQRFHSNLITTLYYSDQITPAQQLQEAQNWHRAHSPHSPMPDARHSTPDFPIRLGLVSPDFRLHSVAYFLQPLLAYLDRARFQSFAYADVKHPDAMTQTLQSLADQWRPIAELTDDQVAAQIRADRIDILIDLAGHTVGNRLGVFAQKPAPIQIAWLGFPGTTGLPAMDYRITDSIADPLGMDAFYSEKLLRLPRGFLCYRPPRNSSAVLARKPGPIVFGSANAWFKHTPSTLRLWSEILRRIPDARLLLKIREWRDADARPRIARTLGIAEFRLEIRGEIDKIPDHLSYYHDIDIALDPLPYNGATTTCEALWMGVPVITLLGQWHAARTAASILTHAGFPEWIAREPDDYVRIAADLAADPARLAEIRTTLRARLQSSSLMNEPTFARDMESAFESKCKEFLATDERTLRKNSGSGEQSNSR